MQKDGGMRIGVDIGGTKIEAAALDGAGRTVARRRLPTPAGEYRATIATVQRLVDDLEVELGSRCTVGIAMPGTISPATGVIKNANSTCLNGRPFDRDLAEALR